MLALRDVTLAYGDHVVVERLHLDAADGEVLCILGPSGCGKSTLLRAIAGLEPLRSGTIHLDGRDLAGLRPDQRGVGLMFQEHALFPHRSVADNVGFGPRVRGLDAEVVRERVTAALELVGLSGTEHRRVDQLSGGERQRVALARAVAPRPRLLMLDEPLGSLDRALQTRLLEELPEVFAELGTTVVYVTHDQDEALALADRVAVMRAGRIEQQGTPDQLWRAPRSRFVAGFLGLDQQVPVVVTAEEVRTPFGVLPRSAVRTADPADHRADAAGPGGAAHAGAATDGHAVLLPESIRLLAPDEEPAPDQLLVTGTVRRRRFRGDHLQVTVEVDEGAVAEERLAVAPGAAAAADSGPVTLHALALRDAGGPGTQVRLVVDPGGVHLLEGADDD